MSHLSRGDIHSDGSARVRQQFAGDMQEDDLAENEPRRDPLDGDPKMLTACESAHPLRPLTGCNTTLASTT